jgi:hypothetical protein
MEGLEAAAQGTLSDPSPTCQFCEMAVSYVKVRLCALRRNNQ